MDPFKYMAELQEKQAKCPHPSYMHMLGKAGVWRKMCNVCSQVTDMTPEEITQAEREISENLPLRKGKRK